MSQLFDWIISIINAFKFWCFVDQDEVGVLLRCGRFRKALHPGPYLVWPILDSVRTIRASLRVVNLPNQSIVSGFDDKAWAASGVVRYRVTDGECAILRVWDIDAAIQNVGLEAIAIEVRAEKPSKHGSSSDVSAQICIEGRMLERIRRLVDGWGVEIDSFSLTDYAPHRVLRLMTGDMPVLGERP